MLSLYNPATQAFETTSGAVSESAALVNILIELRVMNEILLGNAGTNTAEALRSDAVNQTNNAVI